MPVATMLREIPLSGSAEPPIVPMFDGTGVDHLDGDPARVVSGGFHGCEPTRGIHREGEESRRNGDCGIAD